MGALARFSLSRRALVALITVFIAVFGVLSAGQLKRDLCLWRHRRAWKLEPVGHPQHADRGGPGFETCCHDRFAERKR